MKRLHSMSSLAVLLVLLTRPVRADEKDALRLRRVAKVGQLWSEIRFRHPRLMQDGMDWDAALIKALPKVEAAQDAASYAEAVRDMVAVLRDPLTRVDTKPVMHAPHIENPRPFVGWERDVLVLNLSAAPAHEVMAAAGKQVEQRLGESLARARAVVVDLRVAPRRSPWEYELALTSLLPLLYSGEVRVPGMRSTLYSGHPQQMSLSSGGYSVTMSQTPEMLLPGSSGPKPERIVFVMDRLSPVVPRLLGLYARGTGLVVAEGEVGEEAVVPVETMDLGEGLLATFRLGEPGVAFIPDARVPEQSAAPEAQAPATPPQDKALAVAVGMARARGPLHSRPTLAWPSPVWHLDATYPEMLYPDRAYRQLAAIKLWNVVRLFSPNLALLGGAWDGALLRLLPKFEAASDASGYARAVLEFAAQIGDGHTTAKGHPEVDKLLGDAPPPFEVMELEGQPVVVRINLPAAVPGLKVGDVVEAVDGVLMSERVQALANIVSASTEAHRRYRLQRYALSGPDGSEMVLRVRDANGTRQIKGRRDKLGLVQAMAGGREYEVLPGNIGYVDMSRLLPENIEAMEAAMEGTSGLVVDLRGYPKTPSWPISMWLNQKGAQVMALFERNLVGAEGVQRMKFEQRSSPPPGAKYPGRVVVLIDERAISQSEHACLDLEAANAVTFVGSPTAGANGDITDVTLPGGMAVTFTGHEVRHADGRQLQRVGIRPHIPVRPTIAGLRAGRDEVLERALLLFTGGARLTANQR